MIEKNLAGVYSDEMFKEQNRFLEEKIKDIQITKNDELVTKYNLQAITAFLEEKFTDLSKNLSGVKSGTEAYLAVFDYAPWTYPGVSSSKLSPYFQAILDIEENSSTYCAEDVSRTHI